MIENTYTELKLNHDNNYLGGRVVGWYASGFGFNPTAQQWNLLPIIFAALSKA
jgi:hypothetical protein